MLKYICAAIAFAAFLGATSARADTIVALPYVAPASAQPGEPALTLGAVTDERQHGSDWLGAIRGGYGNPLKTLRTEGPVTGAVAAALQAGIDARGLAGSRFRLDVRVVRFDCNQVARKEAHIALALSLVDLASAATVYDTQIIADRVEGSILSLRTGIFASSEELRALANAVLQEAVDRALDDPGLRTTLTAAAQSAPVLEAAPAEPPAAETAPTETSPPLTEPVLAPAP